MTAAVRSEHYLNLFRAALGQSARDGEGLLREVFHAALRSLDAEIAHAAGQPERDQLRLSCQWLDNRAAALCAQFPAQLRQVFQSKHAISSQFGELALGELNHDQLEQMDETQVQERVEMARVLRSVQLLVQDSLNELNGYMSALEGLDHIKQERNPLRPQIYLKVLHQLMVDAAVPTSMRIIWLNHMAAALGKALHGSYALLVKKIKSYGVTPLSLAQTVPPERTLVEPVFEFRRQQADAVEAPAQPGALTLHRLHELFATQTPAPQLLAPDEVDTQFSGTVDLSPLEDDDEPTTDFAATIPVAFEALQNMIQVDNVLARLPKRHQTVSDADGQPESIRQKFRRKCQTSAQVLSFEVMCQMVDNLVQDPRLLEPIRRVIEDLEPALFQLVKVDVRFFNNKLHPARRLLQELTQRGLAFEAVDAPGCALFIRSLHRYVNPLSRMPVENAEPFELALKNLNAMWSEQSQGTNKTVEQAKQALSRAEERNLLAEKMVAILERIPDMKRVHATVAEFILGPWAQVMAYVELDNSEGVEDPGEYKSLVNFLLWSAQPELTRGDVGRLTRQVASLLSKLREGLALIDYPTLKTSAFFDSLMKLHQQAFSPAVRAPELPSQDPGNNSPGKRQHWVAPAEVQASGFMDLADEAAAYQYDQPGAPLLESVIPMASQTQPVPVSIDLEQLAVGTWVEIRVKDVWQRAQLSWISPQHTMYLFTNQNGRTRSMARESIEKLLATQALQVVSEQSMVDGALDAVVHTAMLNSLDLRL
ncbi:DUF1631 family protein [Rhodoferax sp.]|uniref:DUF1631 family protein n=1 Tax=Rhodoferax sp. TaxID=50421 RepID=UPI0026026BC0|nr:DUF1631 family protein [Rhodoferax sp.]MDD2918025.1 DUF1631 family protein [Rhodoferax sp.]